MIDINDILQENERRCQSVFAPFNPLTSEGSIGERVAFTVDGLHLSLQYIPVEMLAEPYVKSLLEAGSVDVLVRDYLCLPITDEAREKVVEEFRQVLKLALSDF